MTETKIIKLCYGPAERAQLTSREKKKAERIEPNGYCWLFSCTVAADRGLIYCKEPNTMKCTQSAHSTNE